MGADEQDFQVGTLREFFARSRCYNYCRQVFRPDASSPSPFVVVGRLTTVVNLRTMVFFTDLKLFRCYYGL